MDLLEMKTFNYKNRKLSSGPHLLGILLIFTGIFAILSPTFIESGSSLQKVLAVGVGSFLLGCIIIFSYSGTLLDFNRNKYKKYFSLCGFKFGQWDDLLSIETIQLSSHTFVSSNLPNGISPTLSGKVTDFKVTLLSTSQAPLLTFFYEKRKKAIQDAKLLAEKSKAILSIKIPDYE